MVVNINSGGLFKVLVMAEKEWSSRMLKIVQSLNSIHHKGIEI
jgi:hypothetical protein